MNAISRLDQLPDWPARMTAPVAAAYMGVSQTKFLEQYRRMGVKDGGNVFWARAQLDRIIAKQFALPQLPGRSGEEDDSWGDLR